MSQEHEGKLSERTFMRMIVTSIVGILLCICGLCSTTWAWFTGSVVSTGNSITTASFNMTLNAVEKDTEKSVVLLRSGATVGTVSTLSNTTEEDVTYTVTLTLPKGSASGHCILTSATVADPDKTVETFATASIEAHENDTPVTLTFEIVIEPGMIVTFEPRWGISSVSTDHIIYKGCTAVIKPAE